MHETVFARRLITEANRHGDVTEIDLEIGELAPVPALDLVETMRRLVPWKIKFNEKQSKVTCKCGYKGRPKILERGHDFFFIECPNCGDIPTIDDGTEIKLIKIKVR